MMKDGVRNSRGSSWSIVLRNEVHQCECWDSTARGSCKLQCTFGFHVSYGGTCCFRLDTVQNSFVIILALFAASSSSPTLLPQGMARQSSAGTLRAAGYRSIERSMLQLGAGATPYLATPALPALLAEVRAVIAASSPTDTSAAKDATAIATAGGDPAITVVAAGRTSGAGISATKRGGMRVEPAMSARKSSQKKQRRSREKEVGRALAAADTAAASVASRGGSVGGGGGVGGGGRGGAIWSGAASEAEREAVCAGMSCLTQLVLCCKGHLPLGGRLAVDEVVHQGLGVLARTDLRGKGVGIAAGGSGACSPLEDPMVARKFVGLAHACLVTPLVSVQ